LPTPTLCLAPQRYACGVLAGISSTYIRFLLLLVLVVVVLFIIIITINVVVVIVAVIVAIVVIVTVAAAVVVMVVDMKGIRGTPRSALALACA
jgi:hypothetical protein